MAMKDGRCEQCEVNGAFPGHCNCCSLHGCSCCDECDATGTVCAVCLFEVCRCEELEINDEEWEQRFPPAAPTLPLLATTTEWIDF